MQGQGLGDDYDDYGDYPGSSDSSQGGMRGDPAKVIANQPHDEEVNLSDDDDNESNHMHMQDGMQDGMGGMGMQGGYNDGTHSGEDSPMMHRGDAESMQMGGMGRGGQHLGDSPPPNVSDDDRGSDDLDSPAGGPAHHTGKMDALPTGGHGSDEDGEKGGGIEGITVGAYNPEDYAGLNVTDEIRELFQYIGRYKPQSHQLDTKLKPFIPDYIPAVGDIDEFIKVGRPDGKQDDLGLKVLDEPAAKQADPTVLNLQLRQVSKQANLKPMEVTSLDHTNRNPRKIENWIKSIQDLHKNKPRPSVSYTKNMPDIETLMEQWPPELEEMLRHIHLPDENLQLPMHEYIKVLCNILDIPVYQNPIESLHVMLTLYLEFKNNPFLKGGGAAAPAMGGTMGGADTLFMDG